MENAGAPQHICIANVRRSRCATESGTLFRALAAFFLATLLVSQLWSDADYPL